MFVLCVCVFVGAWLSLSLFLSLSLSLSLSLCLLSLSLSLSLSLILSLSLYLSIYLSLSLSFSPYIHICMYVYCPLWMAANIYQQNTSTNTTYTKTGVCLKQGEILNHSAHALSSCKATQGFAYPATFPTSLINVGSGFHTACVIFSIVFAYGCCLFRVTTSLTQICTHSCSHLRRRCGA